MGNPSHNGTHDFKIDRLTELKYVLADFPFLVARKEPKMDEMLETLEPVVLGPADELTEFGWNGGDDNSRSDFWWWF